MSANTYEALNAKVGRRSFLKMAAVSTAFGVTSSFASTVAMSLEKQRLRRLKILFLVQKL